MHGISALVRTKQHRRLRKYRKQMLDKSNNNEWLQCDCGQVFDRPRKCRWGKCSACRARELINNQQEQSHE